MSAQTPLLNPSKNRQTPRAFIAVVALMWTLAWAWPLNGSTQPVSPVSPVRAASAATHATELAAAKPSWSDLTALQQQALKPLTPSWAALSEGQKRKWLEVSKNYPALAPADRATLHSRMVEWVALSPQQRAQARFNFAKAKELSPQPSSDEKKAKWETYQALSPEEKQRLVSSAGPKPTGAALAIKPVAPQKLANTAQYTAKSDPKAESKTNTPANTKVLPTPAGTPQPPTAAAQSVAPPP